MNIYLKNMALSLFITLVLGNITFGQDFFFGNNKPIADAGKDIITRPGETIFLDGSRIVLFIKKDKNLINKFC